VLDDNDNAQCSTENSVIASLYRWFYMYDPYLTLPICHFLHFIRLRLYFTHISLWLAKMWKIIAYYRDIVLMQKNAVIHRCHCRRDADIFQQDSVRQHIMHVRQIELRYW